MERIYAVVDHTRCLAYMLGDGIIPSNVKAGYLARLVIRRTLRLMKELGLSLPLAELVEMQIQRLDYSDWQERFVTIKEILDQEEQKYAETLEKGKRLVKKTAEHFKKMGQPIPLAEMISLYDTHGIPPEIARESAEEMGATVELPDNFYSLVAKKRIRAETGGCAKVILPGKTELLFYEHPFEQVFEAQVLDVTEDGSVILDRTLLYPEGGGQPADHGTLEKDGQVFQVVDVQKSGDVVLHKLEKPEGLAEGRPRHRQGGHAPPAGARPSPHGHPSGARLCQARFGQARLAGRCPEERGSGPSGHIPLQAHHRSGAEGH